MHDTVKMQALQNCIADLETKLLQHGECFARSPDKSLGDREHAHGVESLDQFMQWRRDSADRMLALQEEMQKLSNLHDQVYNMLEKV